MNNIWKIIAFAGLLLTGSLIYGQDVITRNPGDYSAINVSGNVRLELSRSDKSKLEITSKNVPQENLTTEIKNNELIIKLKSGSKDAQVKIRVYYSKDLEKLTAASKALITSGEVLKGQKVEFNALSGGKIELELNLDELKADVSQGAALVFKGSVRKQDVLATTGGIYSAYPLNAEETNVRAATGGKAKVRASKTIDASSSSGAFIGYIGDPTVKSSKTSLGGTITQYKTDEDAGLEE